MQVKHEASHHSKVIVNVKVDNIQGKKKPICPLAAWKEEWTIEDPKYLQAGGIKIHP